MGRATTQRFGHAQSAAAGPSKPSAASKEAGQGGNNPLFNTEKFGQHILKVSNRLGFGLGEIEAGGKRRGGGGKEERKS